jgi:hypothetical protein
MRNRKKLLKTVKIEKVKDLTTFPRDYGNTLGKKMEKRLLHFFNNLWKQGIVPKEWETAFMINIYKKGKAIYATVTEEFPYYLQNQKYMRKF